MERNSAACALEWSIELEKALRSKKPGRALEVIQQIGSCLERWNGELEPTAPVYGMFDLVAGEDRLFANTILLRLANAFKLGDRHTRCSIVKVFLSEMRHREKKKNMQCKGILSENMVQNHEELLTRIKIVFDTGDIESRALALLLFGCWADFAKDSGQIRYLVLSSLISPHILEIKASLFAAACFSELADDFAYVFVEMLVKIVKSSTTSAVRLAAARVFPKLRFSYSIAKIAYKTGLNLISDSSEDDFSVAMLVSLSKIASSSILLRSEHVDLLCSFLSQEKPLHIREIALRCMRFLMMKGACHFTNFAYMAGVLVRVLDEAMLPTAAQCDGLKILHKILSYVRSNQHLLDMIEFSKMLTVVKDASQSPILPKSLSAIHILVDLLTTPCGIIERISGGSLFSSMSLHLITVIMDQTTLLVKEMLDPCQTNSEVLQAVKSLPNFLLRMVREHPDLDVLVVNKICSFVRCSVGIHHDVMDTRQVEMMDSIVDVSKEVNLKHVLVIYRLVGICIEYLNRALSISAQVFENVKLLVDYVCQSSEFNSYKNNIYSLMLHSKFLMSCMVNENNKTCDLNRLSGIPFCKYQVECEMFSLKRAKKLLNERDNWSAYRVGIFSAGHGSWSTATFIFGHLMTKVHSNSYNSWLKSLYQFSLSEWKIQMLILAENGSSIVDWLENEKSPIESAIDGLCQTSKYTAGSVTDLRYCEKLSEAYQCLCSSGKTLGNVVTHQTFCFQRWFLFLRAKIVGTLRNILEVLGSIPINEDFGFNGIECGENDDMVTILRSLQDLTRISSRLVRLARLFDLIVISYVDMDSKSSKEISALCLSCSLLAFCTGFPLFVPNLSETLAAIDPENFESYSHAVTIENLVDRLGHVDDEMSKKLCQLLEISGVPKNCSHLHSRSQISNFGFEATNIISLCRFAVNGLVCLQNEVERLDEKVLVRVTRKGAQFLLDIFMKWLHIPFRIPKYFFHVRPCTGIELFTTETESGKQDGISILPGFHLSLNICVQMRHVPSDLTAGRIKLYCILFCSSSFQEPRPNGENKEQESGFQAWDDDDVIQMNDRLFQYVTEISSKKMSTGQSRTGKSGNSSGDVHAFVHFKTNERGQGFSSCLLDVSGFPIGCYRIKWFSCFVDCQGNYRTLLPLNAGPVFTIR